MTLHFMTAALSEAVGRRCSVKKVFSKISQIHRKTSVPGCLAQVFLLESCEMLKSTFFYRTPPVALSVISLISFSY